jgi:transcriptional regulator with XRE-family HTH domain
LANINKEVGKRIRVFREKKHWTQEELAFEADLHRAYIGQIERGEKNLGLINLQKIAKALNIRMSRLVKDSKTNKPEILPAQAL